MKKILLSFLILTLLLAAVGWLRYGGGENYPDLTTTALLGEDALEEVLSYPEPIGNLAVSADGRLFFTVHPEARPRGNRLLEYVDGASVPFPDVGSQLDLFDTVLGIAIDQQNRLWTIDHGNHGLQAPRLLAFDLDKNEIIRDQRLPPEIAPAGSFLQDLQISADGRTVIIADASIWRLQPALIVYDVKTATARRVLEGTPGVASEDYLIRTTARDMRYLGGILTLKAGVDGLALGDDWLYFGALTGSGLYRVALADLRDTSFSDKQLATRVERIASKPLSDGMSIDLDGNVFVTDVEHNAVFIVSSAGDVSTLLRSRRIRWPDALSFGPDGWLYVADSALPDVVLQPRAHIQDQKPYRIFRFRPGTEGTPGQ